MIKKLNNSKGISTGHNPSVSIKDATAGITLIALVITIIVLLILSGVAISMLSGENGILKQASNARKQTEKASTEEKVKLAALAGLTAGKGHMAGDEAFDALNKGLDEAGYTGEDITKVPAMIVIKGDDYLVNEYGKATKIITVEKFKESGGELAKDSKVTLADTYGDIITIPEDFIIKEDSPIIVDEGIVVVAPDGSEFVWVPVTDITKMASETGGVDSNNRKNYQGKLYDFKSENGVYSATEMTDYGQGIKGYREPSLVTGSGEDTYAVLKKVSGNKFDAQKDYHDTILDYRSAIDFGKAMQEDYNEMIESVKENKGFYVGRYETSLNDSGYAQSIFEGKSAKSSDDATKYWYGLYKVQKEYSKDDRLADKVGSSMIWGSQYDQMMIWMQGNNIDVTLPTPINLEGEITSKNPGESSVVGRTGIVPTDKLNNIYDLLGNGYEWTLEADTSGRVYRGGDYINSFSPISRGHRYGLPSSAHNKNCSRLALYIK